MKQPSESKKTEQVGAILLLCLLVIVCTIIFGIRPQISSLKENNITAAAKKDDLKDRQDKLNNLQTLAKEINANKAIVQKLAIALPTKEKLGELLIQVDTIANNQNLKIINFTPSLVTQQTGDASKDFTEDTGSASTDGTASTTTIPGAIGAAQTYAFTMAVSGNYSSIVTFMKNLEQNLRPMVVKNAEFAAAEGGNPAIDATFEIETYYQK